MASHPKGQLAPPCEVRPSPSRRLCGRLPPPPTHMQCGGCVEVSVACCCCKSALGWPLPGSYLCPGPRLSATTTECADTSLGQRGAWCLVVVGPGDLHTLACCESWRRLNSSCPSTSSGAAARGHSLQVRGRACGVCPFGCVKYVTCVVCHLRPPPAHPSGVRHDPRRGQEHAHDSLPASNGKHTDPAAGSHPAHHFLL